MDGPDGRELVIVFPPTADPKAAKSFIRRSEDGRFSSLTFQSALMPYP
jgi:hypothetical protein